MSYDLKIKSDDRYSESVDQADLASFIEQLPHMVPAIKGFRYRDGESYYMEIDLEIVDEEGNTIRGMPGSPKDRVNCVSGHIPYAFMDEDQVNTDRYFEPLMKIAQRLRWRLYDPQIGEDIYTP
jgi:hypothetical protein